MKKRRCWKAGWCGVPTEDQSIYPYFRHRLIFPILTVAARSSLLAAGRLKMINSPNIFNSEKAAVSEKGSALWCASARAAVGDGLPLLVTEGYMDVIAVHMSGLAAAVAPLGTALTEDQISLLWRMDEQPVLCFDGDRAGKAAALKALIRALPLLEPGKTLRLMLLPPGQDPDDVLRQQGREAFSALLKQSISFLDALWDGLATGIDLADPAARAGFWQNIETMSVRSVIRRCAPPSVMKLKAVLLPCGRHPGGAAVCRLTSRSSRLGRNLSPNQARLILAILIEHPELIAEFYEQVGMLTFHHEKMEKLRQIVINAVIISSNLDDASFRHHLNEFGFGVIRGITLLDGMEKEYPLIQQTSRLR